MVNTEEITHSLKVIKRNGKKVDFDGAKIAVAIKKGFDSIVNENEESKYTEKDIQKIYQAVVKNIEKEYKNEDKIKIESIQDMIEVALQKYNYEDVYKSFSEYRDRRSQSRQAFLEDKRLHKISKIFEGLVYKSST